ncbi:hypothetical protein [Marinomonas algicola]|uniref:hypothetical protein n=1 Tax=Marinomonas algicola TaxID=2773454 RepID=UPI00174871C4|nr:hypothetical protein [Marinomonas algicola]
MASLVPYLVWLFILVFCLFVGYLLYRDHQVRSLARLKAEEELLLICDKLSNAVRILPDRYLPIELKSMLLTYIVNGYTKLANHPFTMEQLSYKKEMTLLFEEIYSDTYIASDEKVVTAGRLEQVQHALLKIPTFIKRQTELRQIDRASAKDYLEKIRYCHALAKIDILMKQGDDLLDMDKKASALEHYRTALTDAEKINLLVACDDLIKTITRSIQQVEKQLHINQNVQQINER